MAMSLHHTSALIIFVTFFLIIDCPIAKAQQGGDLESLNQQVAQLYQAGQYREATDIAKRALALAERQFGLNHPRIADPLVWLAMLYRAQGRYGDAEPLYRRALAIDQEALGPDHRTVARVLNNLASLCYAQGRYGEAEILYKRALAIDGALGDDNLPDVPTELNNLAVLYEDQGRYAEAEPLFNRALAIDEKTLGLEHPDVGRDLNNLADLRRDQGRTTEAEALYGRALAIDEKVRGADHPDVARDLNNLADLYRDQGRYFDAESLLKRSIAIEEKTLGHDHPYVGKALNNLADLYSTQGRYADAEPFAKDALATAEKALGPDHPDVAADLNSLAVLYEGQGRYTEAESLFNRALAIDAKALGPDHLTTSLYLDNLARLYFSQGQWARAADYWRGSTGVIIRRAQRGTPRGEAPTEKRKTEAERRSSRFWGLVKAVYRLASKQPDAPGLPREMFQTAQWAQSSEAADSLAQMATRGAKGDPKLAALVRERQDLVAEWQRRDEVRSAAVARAPDTRDRSTEAENVARIAAIDTRIVDIDKELTANFPDYAALASPAPLSAEEVQAQLAADEALVLFLDTPEWEPTLEETFIWVVTKSEVRWVRSELGTAALTREVAALRCGLDYRGAWFDGKGAWDGERCNTLLNLQKPYGLVDHDVLGKPLPFDLARAHALYKALVGGIEDLIKDKRLLIVPAGPLTQFPFQVLVTDPPKTALPASAIEYRGAAWLARKHAITVLPAVSSLKALRQLAKESHASEKYIGFGNPLLDGDPDKAPDEKTRAKRLADAQLARDKRCRSAQSVQTGMVTDLPEGNGRITRGPDGLADNADLRKWDPLPETADEVCDVANILGVDIGTQVYIGADAREATVKRLSDDGQFAKYKIVHFATHGTLAGQLSTTAEPGLILTPPEKGTEIDDGYLGASEIAGLKLDADWVILSACNTAAGDAQSAEALSGLARAFFYAGARSLLVSHWYVSSTSTVSLITTAVAMLTVDPKIGRAEALRRSMLSLMKSGKDDEAHPAFWAPFVLVGEGGAAR
jgi:CHAT domain-containing protein/tetratricopeptide (TPR) repeat protein